MASRLAAARDSDHSQISGISSVSSVEVIRPPTTTVANGRCARRPHLSRSASGPTENGHRSGHQHRPQPQLRSAAHGVAYGQSVSALVVQEAHQNDAIEHRHAEHRDEAIDDRQFRAVMLRHAGVPPSWTAASAGRRSFWRSSPLRVPRCKSHATGLPLALPTRQLHGNCRSRQCEFEDRADYGTGSSWVVAIAACVRFNGGRAARARLVRDPEECAVSEGGPDGVPLSLYAD